MYSVIPNKRPVSDKCQGWKILWKIGIIIDQMITLGEIFKGGVFSKVKIKMYLRPTIKTFKFSRQRNRAYVRALLSQSLSWLPLFVWGLSFNGQLSWAIFSVWFCLSEGQHKQSDSCPSVTRVIWLFFVEILVLFGIYIKTFCAFCEKDFQHNFKHWRFRLESGLMLRFHFDFRKKPTFTLWTLSWFWRLFLLPIGILLEC